MVRLVNRTIECDLPLLETIYKSRLLTRAIRIMYDLSGHPVTVVFDLPWRRLYGAINSTSFSQRVPSSCEVPEWSKERTYTGLHLELHFHCCEWLSSQLRYLVFLGLSMLLISLFKFLSVSCYYLLYEEPCSCYCCFSSSSVI